MVIPLLVAFILANPRIGVQQQTAIPVPVERNPDDRKAVRSESGEFELTVLPQRLFGAGAADYVMRRSGQVVWQGERPFFLEGLVVGDSGAVFGYQYDKGLYDFAERNKGKSHLVLWHIDAGGTAHQLESLEREYSGPLHSPPYPVADDPMAFELSDQAMIAIRSTGYRGGSTRRVLYKLSTGEKLREIKIDSGQPAEESWIIQEEAVGGTDLLAQAWMNDRDLVVTLVDLGNKTRWSKTFPKVWNPEDESPQLDRDPLLPVVGQRRFAVHSGKERIEFEAAPDGSSVKEVGRALYDPDSILDAARLAIPEVTLEPLRTVTYKVAPAAASDIHDVRHFISAGPGRFAYIEGWAVGRGRLMLVTTEGKVVAQFDLSKIASQDPSWGEYVWMGGLRFLVSVRKGEGKEDRYLVDMATGQFQEMDIGLKEGRSIEEVARSTDGLLAISTIDDGLTVYDPKLKPLWSRGMQDENPALYSLGGIDFDTAGRLVVADCIQDAVFVFSKAGKLLNTIDLKKALHQDMAYTTGLSATNDGGFIIEVSSGMHRFDSKGRLVKSFTPHYPDGKVFTTLNAARTDDQGRVWSSDEYALVELDGTGAVKRVVGQKIQPESIVAIEGALVTPAGEIYIQDARSHIVHAFQPDGTRKFVYASRHSQDKGSLWGPGMSVSRGGTLFIPSDDGGEILVDAEGKPVGKWGPLGKGPLRSMQAGGNYRWIQGEDGPCLVQLDGKVLKSITRRPDGGLLAMTFGTDSAWDGSLCVTTRPFRGGFGMDTSPEHVSAFGPQGEPLGTFDVPAWGYLSVLGFDGKRVFLYGEDGLYCFDVSGKPLWRASSKGLDQSYWWSLAPDGSSLALVGPKETRFYRLP